MERRNAFGNDLSIESHMNLSVSGNVLVVAIECLNRADMVCIESRRTCDDRQVG